MSSAFEKLCRIMVRWNHSLRETFAKQRFRLTMPWVTFASAWQCVQTSSWQAPVLSTDYHVVRGQVHCDVATIPVDFLLVACCIDLVSIASEFAHRVLSLQDPKLGRCHFHK